MPSPRQGKVCTRMRLKATCRPSAWLGFFSKDEHGYKIVPELRALVVFTVQDVLTDPPFSRIDLISCRNLLIYLRPDAQAKVISLFHFALREGGILLLGSSETAGEIDGGFEVIAKPERIYRHIGRSRSGEPGRAPESGRTRRAAWTGSSRHRGKRCWRSCAGDWCWTRMRRPLSWSIANWNVCFHWDRPTAICGSLRAAPPMNCSRWRMMTSGRSSGPPSSRPTRRTRAPSSTGGRTSHDGRPISFSIDIQPVTSEGEALLLICFVNETVSGAGERPAGQQRRAAGGRHARTGTRSHAGRASRRHPSAGDIERRAAGDQRRSVVRAGGVPVDE